MQGVRVFGGLLKLGVTFLRGFFIVRIIVFGGLYWGPIIWMGSRDMGIDLNVRWKIHFGFRV